MILITTINQMKAEFLQEKHLKDISVVVNGDDTYLEREVWGHNSFKQLIPVLEKLELSFYVEGHNKLLVYSSVKKYKRK